MSVDLTKVLEKHISELEEKENIMSEELDAFFDRMESYNWSGIGHVFECQCYECVDPADIEDPIEMLRLS